MIKDRYLNTDLYITGGELKNVRLLQSSLAKLSTFRCNEGTIKSITNCSFFSKYVLGRDQGDERENTYADADNGKYCDVVIFKDGTYKYGKFNNYDYRDNVVCGFSPVAILMSEGKDCELYSTPITDAELIVKSKHPRTAFAILKNGTCIQFVSEGRSEEDAGLTGFQVRDYLKENYDIEMLAILDGGGSTELIENGVIVNALSDKNERSMLNGIAIIEKNDIEILYPCASGGDAQAFIPNKHYGLDFGWIKNESDDILACADGEVTFEGFYNDVINGVTYRPIGVIIKHTQFPNYDYYSLYTHLAQTNCDKGQKVKAGEVIGLKGNTGYSKGKHLHFQFMRVPKGEGLTNWNKNAINPQPYMYREEWQIFKPQGVFDIPLKVKEVEEVEEVEENNNAELLNIIEEYKSKLVDLENENLKLRSQMQVVIEFVNKSKEFVDKL